MNALSVVISHFEAEDSAQIAHSGEGNSHWLISPFVLAQSGHLFQ